MPLPVHDIGDINKLRFLVTGGAGFIGSSLVDYLLRNGAGHVCVLDNLSTGYFNNLADHASNEAFEFIEGDIRNKEDCHHATKGIDIVFNTAALGSVPRSLTNPQLSNEVNVNGFINVLWACKEHKVKRIIHSSSSSIYGLNEMLPLKETYPADPISPYAVSKYANELYAGVFSRNYGIEFINLRYFNVFGPKQNIHGPYAAVIPKFIDSLIDQQQPEIFGDGFTSRDFTYIDNVIQANIKAAFVKNDKAVNQTYNISAGKSISLNRIFELISNELESTLRPKYKEERAGDIKNSLADITKAKNMLGYSPMIGVEQGIKLTVNWFKNKLEPTPVVVIPELRKVV